MIDPVFSKSIVELAKSTQCRIKFDDVLTNIVNIDKGQKMSNYLSKAGMSNDIWEMHITILMIELMNQAIYDDESALEYIGKLHAAV
jgi:hypothetical protein